MVELTISRAKAGIRLARLNAWSTLVWVVVTLIVATPELSPTHWQHDAKLRLTLIVQFVVNVPLIVALVAFCAWYIRRQRKRIRHANALLEQLQE
jgi:ABC-type amino acid transport system permease subunit